MSPGQQPWCPRINRSAEECDLDGCTHYLIQCRHPIEAYLVPGFCGRCGTEVTPGARQRREQLTVHSFPMPDTGIGQEAGYESDAAFRQAMEEERAAMPPEVRAAIERAEAEAYRRLLFGEQS